MKLKHFIIIGYMISTIITVVAVLWAVNTMLIAQKDSLFIIGITISASLVGALVSLLLLSRVFRSLDKLKGLIAGIQKRQFDQVAIIQSPQEFQELGQAFNDMSQNLEQTFASLKESEEEKGLMIAQLSHDIKTPLTSIQATVDGMLDGIIATEEHPHYLQTIRRQTDRLNKLVEELNFLTLHSQVATNQAEEQEVILLDKLLIDILSEFQLRLDREGREVDISVQPPSAKIVSNHDKLSRILLNLVSNALKYSPAGSPLSIQARLEGEMFLLEVTDQGQGIKEEDQARIFKRLYRVESSRNMKTGGHGLGLYIARELAHQLGGGLTVTSTYGKGSTFTLTLPQG